eukprot:CAMPEP_0181290650 /NCGR_PEP_ID=MMETSP1101-20121128/1527_1 /TAXON_ID=46948 /ORGANISM="Rhodomonas abbreviata, Strain Caron Lab Isolate" /LENGTH=67 /DNA_ID=CAMNT_0023394949 /DNA_START=551 /DNA_END=754 /DNA_ORIENTATION=+
MLTSLYCSPRLIAVGGFCADNSDAVYSDTIPSKYSKHALISHGVWMTKKQVLKEKEAEADHNTAHFS